MRGQTTVAALRQLDSAGKEGSFEELVASLLARLIRQPVRRARAGSQEGKDALSDDGALAIECKRYAERTPLTARHLITELEEVKAAHPGVQLWILATTTALGATQKAKLDEAAHAKGLAVLHLDTAAAGHRLRATLAIAALCATDVDTSLEFLSRKGIARKLRTELEAIRSDPGFEAWMEWLREEVRNRLPIWRFISERHNLALATQIRETAYTAFGTDYRADQAVRRQACAQLDEWFCSALAVQSPGIPPIAVVVGERYDGKTWLIYQWLLEIAARSPVPIFFVGSARGMQSDRRLTDLQIEDLAPALKRQRSQAEPFVHNYRSQDAGKTPWALIVLDGLNEYVPNHGAWRRHLLAALARGESGCRPAAVLLTVRASTWPELKELLPDVAGLAGRTELTTREIPLGPFTETELQESIMRLRLPAELVETLPESARALAHRPRYLWLLAQHCRRLGDYAAVTPEVLHWLDLCDKVGHMRQGRDDWGPAQHQGFLRNLAKRWHDQRFLDEAGVREIIQSFTPQVSIVLAELRSEGILAGESGNYTVQPDRLAMGYGLFLRDSLLQASRRSKALKEVLRDLLAPLVEGDEAVEALRAASTLMLIEVAASETSRSRESIEVLDVLLWEWLNSRNLGRQDLESIYGLRRLLFERLFRSWRTLWSNERRNSRMREIAVMVFGQEVEAGGEARDRLRTAVKEWFRMVPLEGGWYQRARAEVELGIEGDGEGATAEAVASRIRSRVALPGLGHLGLQVVEGMDVLSLQALGLYLASRAAELVDPDDLLAFTAVRIVLEEPIDSGDFWVVRRAAENVPLQWFEREYSRCAQEPNGILGQCLRELIRTADRVDLSGLDLETEKRRVDSDPWPTKRNYRQLLRRAVKLPSKAYQLAERADELLCDPSLPPPSKEQRQALARTLGKSLSEKIRAGEMDTLRRFEDLLPAMAAWVPDLGAELIGQFLQGLPSRIRKKERPWLLELRGHSALAHWHVRKALEEALRLSPSRDKDWLVHRELTLALLPAATLEETISLLMDKAGKYEHEQTFNLAGALRTAADRRALVDLLKATRSPTRKRRLRFLLAKAGGSPLPAAEVKAICRTLSQAENSDIFAALELVAKSKVEDIDPRLLFPIARGEIAAGSVARDRASRMLVERYDHEQIKDHLDGYWRARSAARRTEDAQSFLDEVSTSLAEYRERMGGIDDRWNRYDLPSQMMLHLDRERVAEWIRAFNAWDGAGWHFWGGLIRPTFEWCLRNASTEQARKLWPDQVYPFQRRRFGGGSRLAPNGVDWALQVLNRPDVDDDLARSFLSELILDARSDLELLEIALGARLRGVHRLREIAYEISADPLAERRVRAVAILGWLVEGKERLEALRKRDPSLWVREQAEIALKKHDLESWARTWLDQFLTAKTPTLRWAAAQTFLACADRRMDTWAWDRIHEGKLRQRLKGEAILLLWNAEERANKKADTLKSTLLGYQVNQLSTVAYPWRRDDEWILDRYGRRD